MAYNARRYPPFPEGVPVAPLVTISLKNLLEDPSNPEHERLFEASKNLGFFYLDMRNTTVGEDLLSEADNLFDLSKNFFDMPIEEKNKYDFAKKKIYFGYKGAGKEVMFKDGTLNRDQQYNIAKDDIMGISKEPLPAPDMVNHHKEGLQGYVKNNYSIMMTILRSLEESLKLAPNTFTSRHELLNASGCHVRFITTLPLSQTMPPDHALGGEHTDFGSLTILLNRIGGLQVQLPGSEDWVYVKPVPGCAIVNLGDALVKFTGGILRSNLHRVVTPPGDHWKLQRQSLVYFLRPDHNVALSRLRGGLIDELGEGDYEGQTSREWLERRHLGRKIEFYKGAETWESLKGTENRPTVKAI